MKYGTIRRRKLIPVDNMAIISVLYAILEVKNITDIKANRGVSRLVKNGIKLK